MRKKEGSNYFTPSTKNRKIVPVPVCVADCPSAHVTSSFIVVFPNPMIGESLAVADAPAARDGIVPLFVFPTRMRPPVKVNFHWIVVAFKVPLFVMTALIPNPPVMSMLKVTAPLRLTFFVMIAVAPSSSVTFKVTG